MSNIQRYCVDWNGEGYLDVEVDHDLLTENSLYEINNFWIDADARLDDQEGNLLFAVLALLAERCFLLSYRGCWSASMLIDAFNQEEGWPPMDGSYGIKIIGCDEPEFHLSEMRIRKYGDEQC